MLNPTMDGSDMGRGHRLRGIECKDRFFDKRVQIAASSRRDTVADVC